jgi:hypothetical protein
MDDSGDGDGGSGVSSSCARASVLPDRLFYDPPRREDYPPRSSSNWRDGLVDVLSSVESSSPSSSSSSSGEQVDINNHIIVLFGDDKFVCIYDMVREREREGGGEILASDII